MLLLDSINHIIYWFIYREMTWAEINRNRKIKWKKENSTNNIEFNTLRHIPYILIIPSLNSKIRNPHIHIQILPNRNKKWKLNFPIFVINSFNFPTHSLYIKKKIKIGKMCTLFHTFSCKNQSIYLCDVLSGFKQSLAFSPSSLLHQICHFPFHPNVEINYLR